MQCYRPYDLIACAKEQLAAPELEAARAHLAACADCRRELAAVDRVFEFLRATPDVVPSPDFVTRVMDALPVPRVQAVREEPTVPAWTVLVHALRERLAGFPLWAVSVSAHLVLFAALTVYFFHRMQGPSRVVETVPRNGPELPGKFGGAQTPDPEAFDPRPTEDPRPLSLGDPEEKLDDPILEFVGIRLDPERKRQAIAAFGGADTEAGVGGGLRWLAGRQRADGSWDAAAEGGKPEYDTGLTGLCTLAFLADGHTHRVGAHRETVRQALDWLVLHQRHDGLLGPAGGNYMYNHGIAATAMLEAYLLTGEDRLRLPTQAAVLFIIHAQTDRGGWGYTMRSTTCDTSVSGWQVPALRLARAAGLRGAGTALQKAIDWFASVTDEAGRVGYRQRENFPNGHEALTAIGMFCRELGGFKPAHEINRRQADLLLRAGPTPETSESDFVLWQFSTLALFQHGGEAWERWNGTVRATILARQAADGSWPTTDRWGVHGGRLYSTAMGALTLSTGWRYPRLYP